ncbi:astacin [Ancylostoma duodenale]|uniref:Metalloendopeptidase n=1 Tax=Ancylostoma duodenale TaxID=51022 RepID=A0A0C2E1E6_9BILA|nr:astacin [Ancylostoma duodenale]
MLVVCLRASLLIIGARGFGAVPIPNTNAKFVKDLFDDYSEKFLIPEDFINAAEKPGKIAYVNVYKSIIDCSDIPVDIPTEAQLEAVQNSQLFEGDIIGMPIVEEQALRRLHDEPIDIDEASIFGRPYHSALNLVTYPEKLWTDAQVPYMLEEGMTNDQRAAIAQAFDEYKEKTCVRFVPRTDDDFDYIYIKRNVAFGCSSYVGRAGGNQTVSLEVDKCFSKGIIAHELMHALGFFHEHSRTDRDQYVDINEENIRPGMLRNFEKYPRKIIDPLGMPYDYESVMHYHKLAFSRNGKATIVPKDRKAEVGQRYKLSHVDAKKVNKLYQCGEFSKTTTTSTTTTTTESTTTTTTNKTPSTTTKSRTKPGRGRVTKTEKPTTTATRRTTTRVPPTTKTTTRTRKTTTKKPHTKEKEKGSEGNRRGTKEKEKITEEKEICKDKNLFCGYWAKIGLIPGKQAQFLYQIILYMSRTLLLKNSRPHKKLSEQKLGRYVTTQYFLEDLIGYGTEEAQRGQLCRERLAYRADMFKSLQAALRDIRSYSYDHVDGKFIPNNRKAKRALPERLVVEENDEE